MTSIVLADDHHIVRQGLRALLDAETDLTVVGEAADGLEALSLVEELAPNILIIDLMMPKLNGMEVVKKVSQRWASTRTIVLSMHADESYVLQALRNGVAGYVLKDSIVEELVRAIHEVVEGRRYLSPPLSERAIEKYMLSINDDGSDPYESLTDREREIFQMAAEGMSNKEIAELLVISPRTVETHRTSFMRKLNLKSRTDLIRFALRRGILPQQE